jgi:helix-turn-helix protein
MATDDSVLDGYLTVDQFASQLGKHPGSLKRWRYQGYGPTPVRIGKTLYYRKADIAAWLDSLGKPEAKRGRR